MTLSRIPWLATVRSKENPPPNIMEEPVAVVPILCEYIDIAHSRSTTRTDLSIRNLRFGDGKIAPFDNNWSYAFKTGSAAPLQAETSALATSSSPTDSTPEFNLSYKKTRIHEYNRDIKIIKQQQQTI